MESDGKVARVNGARSGIGRTEAFGLSGAGGGKSIHSADLGGHDGNIVNIVNIASSAGLEGVPYTAAYCTIKGGIVQLTRSLAVEV
jgi:NADP-dependent 3-hydroxy acid dehydrogenase YdfG